MMLALNPYLTQLEGTQTALSVGQQQPKMLLEVVSFTTEIESYMYLHKPHKVVHMDIMEEASPITAIQTQQGAMMGILED